ncbi:MAG: aminotransferase class I/II-fold pyridoxal phosphate-dependent enzyme [Kyrpidia sp.]|nr:aminotransferase class I/II-fold pyridoxal phosphate-dependent enzyme [Kyrpidia sp.]
MPTPLWDALVRHVSRRPAAWHVPGHKMGRGAPPDLLRWLGPGLRLDLTELPGLDDLHQPEGPIAEAQALAARAAGADESFFLVGGSTAGNVALLLASCEPGETVLVARNVHRSVMSGLILAGASAITVAPDWEDEVGIPGGVRPEAVERALQAHPEVRTVIVTSPTYHGICSDLARLAEVVHRCGGRLFVDEAHGAHVCFVPGSPPCALDSGADAAVQSWHKTAGSLTQSAVLHVRGNRVDRARLRQALALVQSSSPSYLLMASLDLARQWMLEEGGRRLQEAARALEELRRGLENGNGLVPLTKERACRAGGTDIDGARLTLGVGPSGKTGLEWGAALRRRNTWAELEEPTAVTFVAGPGDDGVTVGKLARVLEDVRREMADSPVRSGSGLSAPGHRPFSGTGWTALLKELWRQESAGEAIRPCLGRAIAGRIPVEQAVGRRCGQAVIPYPPGIPLLLPGERIQPVHVELIRTGRALNVRMQGVPDGPPTVAVMEEARE